MLIRSALGAADKRRIQAMLFANNGGSCLRQALLDGAPFLAELTHSLVLSRGTGSPTFTRASTATVMGYGPTDNAVDGLKLLTVAANEARFEGARRISEGVWSNTFADGSLIPAATNTGYLAEGARTQILATADIRDMTTAAWTLGATMTRARTSVGADGAANSANRLTGGAVAATNTCYTTITAAASSRTYSALVKRVTGTGPVRIVQTGTETDISTQLNTTGYALVQLNASILNAVMGFKIDTNGDAIDVDFNQFEDGAFASSRIESAMTRAADVLTYSSAGNVSAAAGWVYVEATVPINNGAPQIQIDDGSSNNRILIDDGNGANGGTRFFIQSGGAVEANIGDFSSSANTSQKRCVTWATNYAQSSQGGLLSAADTSVTTPVSFTQIGVGGVNGGAMASCTIRNLRIGQRQLSASEMQAITAP